MLEVISKTPDQCFVTGNKSFCAGLYLWVHSAHPDSCQCSHSFQCFPVFWNIGTKWVNLFHVTGRFYTPWKHQKTKDLLMFLGGGIERKQWHEAGWYVSFLVGFLLLALKMFCLNIFMVGGQLPCQNLEAL